MDKNELWDMLSNDSNWDLPQDVFDGPCNLLECLLCSRTINNAAFNVGISVLYGTAFALGLVPNLAVLWLLATCHPPGAPMSTALLPLSHTIASLCGLSMLPALIVVTLHGVGDWLSGADVLCKLLFFTFELYQYGSALFMACVGVQQFSTFGSRATARVAMCAVSWLLTVGASLPNLIVVSVTIEERCEPDLDAESIRTWDASVGFLDVSLGCAIAVVVFVWVYVAACRDPAFDCGGGQTELACVYFCSFVVCWVPYHIQLLIEVLKLMDLLTFNCNAVEGVFYGKQVTQCLAFLYSCATAWAFIILRYKRSRRQAGDTVQQTTLALS